jgi:hypothetical protein
MQKWFMSLQRQQQQQQQQQPGSTVDGNMGSTLECREGSGSVRWQELLAQSSLLNTSALELRRLQFALHSPQQHGLGHDV